MSTTNSGLTGFKNLTVQDLPALKTFLASYPPYSDYNSTSLIAWDTTERVAFSLEGGDLAVIFQDYESEAQFVSLLGENNVNERARALIEQSQAAGMGDALKLVPQSTIEHLSPHQFAIQEDRDNFDYILSTEHLSKLLGSKNEDRRRHVKKFMNNHGSDLEIKQPRLTESSVHQTIIDCFDQWEIIRGETPGEHAAERQATLRLLSLSHNLSVNCLAFYIKGQMAAFSIFEILSPDYAIVHFEKCHTHFSGIVSFVRHQVAARLEEEGVSYINYEQDLGIPGLRKSKEMLHPTHFLKKYTVKLA